MERGQRARADSVDFDGMKSKQSFSSFLLKVAKCPLASPPTQFPASSRTSYFFSSFPPVRKTGRRGKRAADAGFTSYFHGALLIPSPMLYGSDMPSILGAQSRMRSCAVQQSAQAATDEASPFVLLGSDRRHPVSCPNPRRMLQPWDPNLQAEVLDVVLAEGARVSGSQVPSSPPYFCGSPPSRAANPLVLDARFGEENSSPSAPLPTPAAFAPSSSGGCVRTNLGASPVAVRIEGFDCRDRGRRRSSGRSSIPSVA